MKLLATHHQGDHMHPATSPHVPVSSNRKWREVISSLINAPSIANIISTIALVVSGLTFWYSYQTQQATQLTSYADKVSYWVDGNNHLVVQNLSNQPISNVMAQAESVSQELSNGSAEQAPYPPAGTTTLVGLGEIIPACSAVTVDASDAARLYLVGYDHGPSPSFSPSQSNSVPVFEPQISLANAEKATQQYKKANGFPVSITALIFTDGNNPARQWARANGSYFGETSQLFHAPVSYVDTAPIHNDPERVGCT
jgi:hypothetical protein